MWTKDVNLPAATKTWQQALDYVASMNTGAGTYGYTDWRLPNRKELFSLVDRAIYSPSLPSGHPFTNVQSDYYWSSTTYANDTSLAWVVRMVDGFVLADGKSSDGMCVWPVRAGQVDNLVNLAISKSGTGSGTVTASTGNLSWSGNTGTTYYSNGTSVTLTAAANSVSAFAGWSGDCTGSSSTCTLTISAVKSVTATFTLASTPTPTPTPNCNSKSITPTSKTIPSSGGSDSISVTANTGCAWTATSNAAWITITSGSSGSGNGKTDIHLHNTVTGRDVIWLMDGITIKGETSLNPNPVRPV